MHRWQPPVLDEMITQFRNYAAAYAHPSAKRLVFHGLAGPVNAVEVDGTLSIHSGKLFKNIKNAMQPKTQCNLKTSMQPTNRV